MKSVLDRAIAVGFGWPDCEFFWVGDDGVDPLQQARTISILVGAGVKTVAEARAELGLGRGAGVAKYNQYHDERGRFTDAEHAVDPGAGRAKTRDVGVQVADNSDHSSTMNDAGAADSSSASAHSVQVAAVDMTQSCQAFIAANRQAKVLRAFPGQFLTSTLEEVIAASKTGDPAAKRACKLLFENKFSK